MQGTSKNSCHYSLEIVMKILTFTFYWSKRPNETGANST
uniref:Uncharacterized protein n=1 Tax=Rhizophora mucronata TaxID=61149 RepID=A0A2P2P5X3_RHIMU